MATDGVKVSNTEITQTFDVWRRNTNDAADRLNSITQSFMNDRITLTGNVEVGGTSPNFEFVVDTTNNRVGIGTSTPAVKLDVDGVTNISDDLKVGISGGGTANLIVDTTNNRVGINTNLPTEALDVTGKVLVSDDLMISGAASNVLFVDTSGTSVGINVDAPTASSLEISGDVLLQNTDELKIKNNGGTSQTVLTVNASDSTILQGSGGTESVAIKSSDGTSRITMTELGDTAFSANVSIPYNKTLSIGDFNDLIFYHDAADSYVQVTTGNLNIQTTFSNSIVVEQGGAVTLYFSDAPNNAKLATTTNGVDITGTTTISSLTDNRITFAGTAGLLEDSADLTFDGTTFEVGGGYGATGVDIDMVGNISADGNIISDGTLTVVGLSSLDGGIDVNAAAFTVSAAGAVDTSSTLTVDGLSSLDGGINVNTDKFEVATDGSIVTSNTLTVVGSSSLGGGIDVNGAFVVATDGGVTILDTLDVTGIAAFSSNTVFDTNVLFVDSVNDRVGIKNDVPTQPLDVTGNILSSATIEGITITDGTATMTGGTVSATTFTTGSFNGTTGTFSANLAVATNVLFVDTANNRVGINTSTPEHPLDISGNTNISEGVIKVGGLAPGDRYLKVNASGTGMEYVDIQAVLSGNGVVSKPLTAPFPNATGNERDVTMWQSNTVITGNTNMLTYDLSTGQLNVKSNGAGSAILSIQDGTNHAELVKDGSDLKIRSDGGSIKFYGDDDNTDITNFQVYSGNALRDIMHENNGGPGTNFDADLLDGQHGYEFSRLVNTTTTSTAGNYYEIVRWDPTNQSDTAVVLTLLITSNRDDSNDYNGSCSALVQVSLVQNDDDEFGDKIDPDIQLLSYSSYGSGSTENIIEDIIVATDIPADFEAIQSVYIKSNIAGEIFTVQLLSESKTGSGVQPVTYPSSGSWISSLSNIQAQTGKIVRQSADFLPKRNNVYDLGSTTDRWAIIYGANGNFSDTVTGPNGTWNSSGIDISGGVITAASGTWDSGGIDIASGDSYAISGTDVLTATALGSGVTGSLLTSVGALNSGSITSSFGNINIGSSTFTGNGSGLTNLVAANISTGSLADGVNLHYTEENATATPYYVSFTNASTTAGSGNKDSLFSDKFSFTPSTGRITSNQISVDANGLIIGGSAVTATAAELNELDGIGTPTDGGIVYGDGTGLKVTAAGTSGQYLKSAGTGTPFWDTINLGTDTAGNYMIDASGSSGITVTHTQSEGSTATIAVDLSDTSIFASDGTASRAVVLDSSGNFSAGTITASLSGTATTATNVTTTNNTATNETVYVAFVDGTSGGQGIEVDSTGLTYNPSTNTLTVANLSGTATNLSRSVIAGNGLTDGGSLNGSDATLNVGAGDGISVAGDTVAVNSTVLRTTGSQSISGDKIFQDNVELYFGTGSTTDAWMYWDGSHLIHKSWGNVYFDFNSAANDDFIIRDGTTERMRLDATTGDLELFTGDFIASSDARVKDNIETMTDSIGVLNQLRPVSYTRKDHVDKETKHYGLIAQEVMDVLPAIVHGSEEDGYKLSYIQLISHLIEGIQTLDKRVKELENGN